MEQSKGIGTGPHGLHHGGRFDQHVKKATNLCKKILAVAAACFTFLSVTLLFLWGASSEHISCEANPEILRSCDYIYYKTLAIGIGVATVLAILVYKPLNERAQTVLIS